MEDTKIIDLYFARSEQAIEETSHKYGAYLGVIADNILHRPEDTEEVVNDVYLAAWNSIPPNRPRVLKHYLSRIARNLSFKRFEYLSADKRCADTVLFLSELDECIPDERTPNGTDGTIFQKIPPELGFFCEGTAWDWETVEEALNAGKIVVSLQYHGHFTKTGHYLALVGLTDEGDVIIRDSNIYNYGRLAGHKVDHFDPQLVIANNAVYWIFQPKIRRIEACSRCGDPDNCGMPEGLLLEDYTCEKCLTALTRRNAFLALNAG